MLTSYFLLQVGTHIASYLTEQTLRQNYAELFYLRKGVED